MCRKTILSVVQLLALSICIALIAFLFKNNTDEGVNWTFPYFSGAANFDTLFEWRISPSEYEKVAHMPAEVHRSYHYVETKVTIRNTVNSYGYVLIALAARNLFPWFGDIQAVIFFQTLVHISLSLFVLRVLLQTKFQRVFFFLIYACNPVVLHFVTFPFYYFWTVIPSVALAVVFYKPDKIQRWLPFLAILMLFSLLIRPTTLFVALFVFAVALCCNRQKATLRIVVITFIMFIAGLILFSQQNRSRLLPFHTAYVGIGAYSNPYGISNMDDAQGYRYYKLKTRKSISTNAIHGNWNNPEVVADYQRVLMERYFQIVKETPGIVIRNAALNTIQSFGVGYDVKRVWTMPFTVAIGLVVIALIFVTKQWVLGFGVFVYAAGFTFYFPPIPAYLFGAYILIVIGCGIATEKLFVRWKFSKLNSISNDN